MASVAELNAYYYYFIYYVMELFIAKEDKGDKEVHDYVYMYTL